MWANISPLNSNNLRHVFFEISRIGVNALEIMVLQQLQDYVLRMLIEFECKRSLAAKLWPLGSKIFVLSDVYREPSRYERD